MNELLKDLDNAKDADNGDLTAGLDKANETAEKEAAEKEAAEKETAEKEAAEATPAGPTERESLEKRAEAAGVTFRANISDANLLKRVEEAEGGEKRRNPDDQSNEKNPNPDIDREKLKPTKSAKAEMEAGRAWLKARNKA